MAILDNYTWGALCDEASGNIIDILGVNNLIQSGGVGSAEGGRDFERSSSQYASHVDATAFNMNGHTAFTIRLICKLESKPAAVMDMLAKGDNANGGYFLRIDGTADRFKALICGGSGFGSQGVATANSLGSPSTGVDYHILFRHDPVADTVSIQVNNGTIDSVSHSAGVFDSAGLPFSLSWNQFSEYFDGIIKGADIWKRVLTEQEGSDIYNGGDWLRYPFDLGGSLTDVVVDDGLALVAGGSAHRVNFIGTNTDWLSGTPTIVVDNGTLGSITVDSDTTAHADYTPHVTYTGIITFTDETDGDTTDTLTVVPAATGYSLLGPSGGITGQNSPNFTVQLTPSGSASELSVIVTPAISPDGTTSGAITLPARTVNASDTFTVNPAADGSHTVSTSDNRGLTDPSSLTYISGSVPIFAGRDLIYSGDTIVESPGSPVASWTDLSGAGNHATQGNGSLQPIASTINGHPCIETDGSDRLVTPSILSSSHNDSFYVIGVLQRVSGTGQITVLGSDSNNFRIYHTDGTVSDNTFVNDLGSPRIQVDLPNLDTTPPYMVCPTLQGPGNTLVIAVIYDGTHLTIEVNGLELDAVLGSNTMAAAGALDLTGALAIGTNAAGSGGGPVKWAWLDIGHEVPDRADWIAETLRLRQIYLDEPLPRIITCVGDSTMYGQTTSNPPVTGPPGFIPDNLTYLGHAINRGIGSSTVEVWDEDYIDFLIANITSDREWVFVVCIGGNDVSVASTRHGHLQSLCEKIQAGGGKVEVCTIPQRGSGSAALDTYNDLIRANWESYADYLCDLYDLPDFNKRLDVDGSGAVSAQTGNLAKYSDGTHLTDGGSEDWGTYMALVLDAPDVYISAIQQIHQRRRVLV